MEHDIFPVLQKSCFFLRNYDDSLLLPELVYQEFYFLVQKSIYIIGIQSVKVIRDLSYLSFLYFNFILGEGNPVYCS